MEPDANPEDAQPGSRGKRRATRPAEIFSRVYPAVLWIVERAVSSANSRRFALGERLAATVDQG